VIKATMEVIIHIFQVKDRCFFIYN